MGFTDEQLLSLKCVSLGNFHYSEILTAEIDMQGDSLVKKSCSLNHINLTWKKKKWLIYYAVTSR